ncbi:M15 family metallopeptidase [Acuticoccus sediminis]|nr:M15 family metallopeptidase [Acuticoccus sediminis]
MAKAAATIDKGAEKAGKSIEKELRDGAKGGERALESLSRRGARSLGDLTQGIGAVRGALAGAFAAAGVGELVSRVREATAAVAEMNKEAAVAGLDTTTFQEFSFVARKFRVSQDAIVDGFKEMQLRADEFAVTGKGSAADAFARLGYGVEDVTLKLQRPAQFFDEIIDRVRQLGSTAAQIRVLDEIFGGTGGEQLMTVVRQSTQSMSDLRREAHEVGAVLSGELIDKAVVLDQRIADLSTAVQTKLRTAFINAGTAAYGIVDAIDAAIRKLDTLATEFGNSDFWSRINNWAAANGLMSVPEGMTILDNDLAGTIGNRAIEDQRKRVAYLENEIAEVNRYMALPDGERGVMTLDGLRDRAAELTRELAHANAELRVLEQTAGTIHIQPIPVPNQYGPYLQGEAGLGAGVGGSNKSFSALEDSFEGALRRMIADAKAAGHDISLNSGFRSNERQAELFAAAVEKYGSEQAARKWVAPPGGSKHNYGLAADLGYGNDAARQWAHQNAANYGLNFRMSHEPWHVEPNGASIPSANPAPNTNRDADAAAAKRQADAIQRVTQQLQFENDQLGRSTLQQQIHQALRQAGITIDSEWSAPRFDRTGGIADKA